MLGMTIAAAPSSADAALPDNRIRVGYARVSTRGQDHQTQLDALAGAHCRSIVVKTASTRAERPKLRAALDRLQPGDTLVIYKPDRVAQSSRSSFCRVSRARAAFVVGVVLLVGG
jgi:DNA invertase Pin-like site-specific DNA recombinase